MKKVTSLLAIVSLIVSTSFADITEKQLETYLDISGAGAILETIQTQIGETVEAQAKARGETINKKAMATIIEVMSSDKNLAKFTEGLKKLDPVIYNEIIAFYHTKVGEKGAEVAKSMDMGNMARDMQDFFQARKENPFSSNKITLINKITKATHVIETQTKMTEGMMISMNDTMPKGMKIPQNKIHMMLAQMQPRLEQQATLSMHMNFKDYNEEELEKVLQYSLSNAGSTEAKIMMQATIDYIKDAMTDMMKSLLRELEAEHPKAFQKAA